MTRPHWAQEGRKPLREARTEYGWVGLLDAGHAAEIARYLVWLGEYRPGTALTAEQLGDLVHGWVTLGRWPGELIADLGLPQPPQYPEFSDEVEDDWRVG